MSQTKTTVAEAMTQIQNGFGWIDLENLNLSYGDRMESTAFLLLTVNLIDQGMLMRNGTTETEALVEEDVITSLEELGEELGEILYM